jgi:hypothetical protein
VPLHRGPTSSGKTSLVEYLAERTGHRFMRINNHEHTDLQEYLGSYVTDANGKGGIPFRSFSLMPRVMGFSPLLFYSVCFTTRTLLGSFLKAFLGLGFFLCPFFSPPHARGKAGFRSLLIRPNTVGDYRAGRLPESKTPSVVPTVYWRNVKMCLSQRGNSTTKKSKAKHNTRTQSVTVLSPSPRSPVAFSFCTTGMTRRLLI